ncbi:MAG: efflux RND transporter periplasmic adaptor subunit [Desulfobacteraceae bacterium]|jgi:RND family efflux transporter MFP subunit
MQVQKIISIVIGILFFGTAVVLWARPEPEIPGASENHLPQVRVGTVQESMFQRTVKFSGITRAAQRANLSFVVAGRMAGRNVEVGETIQAHEPIARLNDEQFQNAVETAKANLAELQIRVAQAERDRRRISKLVAGKAATSENQEQISANYEALLAGMSAVQTQVAEAQRQLKETVLYAPFTGTITAILMEPGEWAGPGQPVVEITGHNQLELVVEVPETVVSKIRISQPVVVELPFAERSKVKGEIVSVAGAASGSGRLFPVLVRLAAHPNLAAGMTAELIIQTAAEEKINVPLKAIINPGAGQPALFRLNGDRVERVALELGRIMDDRVAVIGALQLGDQIVVTGHTALTHGDRVEVQR